jgi:hypothetical protein
VARNDATNLFVLIGILIKEQVMKTSKNDDLSTSGVLKNRKISGRSVKLIFGASIFLLVGAVQADSRDDNEDQQIEGAWVITIDPPGSIPGRHIAFGSFAEGGVFTGSPDNFLPPNVGVMGTNFGSWKHVRGDTYASTFVAFTYSTAGTLTGTVKLNANYTLTGKDRFTGVSQLFFCSTSLVCPATALGTARLTGQRLKIEPVIP